MSNLRAGEIWADAVRETGIWMAPYAEQVSDFGRLVIPKMQETIEAAVARERAKWRQWLDRIQDMEHYEIERAYYPAPDQHEGGSRLRAMKCVACGDHPLNYIHCDRWDCPLLIYRQRLESVLAEMPDDEDEPLLSGTPMAEEGDDITPRGYFCGIGGHEHATEADADACADSRRMPPDDEEDERDPAPPDEDDDEIAVDWDENGYWPEENDEVEEEE